jgi:hypothetical protein
MHISAFKPTATIRIYIFNEKARICDTVGAKAINKRAEHYMP